MLKNKLKDSYMLEEKFYDFIDSVASKV